MNSSLNGHHLVTYVLHDYIAAKYIPLEVKKVLVETLHVQLSFWIYHDLDGTHQLYMTWMTTPVDVNPLVKHI